MSDLNKINSLLNDLKFRGLIGQVTNLKGLSQRLKKGPIVLYAGFDPTADSLHIGNLLLVLALKRFQLAGHKPIALVGGATGLIGDPSGKTTERVLNPEEKVKEWTEKIKQQLARFLDFGNKKNPAQIVNNYQWFSDFRIIEFLRQIGKHFSLNYMLAKESVKTRLQAGISFTEFSYMLLQAYDFLKLNQDLNCELQIGGSDQWGNITAGIDLIRKTTQKEVYGLTFPLVTKADGTKFGKTETGTIWLDSQKTTPYQFYQFWINTDDRDVIKFLKYFTFLSKEEILDLEKEVKNHPEKRKAQRILAKEVTSLVHGEKASQRAEKISLALFYGDLKSLSENEIKEGLADVPSFVLKEKKINLVDLLVKAKISPSKRQAREDIKNGAIYLNGFRQNEDKELTLKDRLYGKFLIIRRGKKNYFLINWV